MAKKKRKQTQPEEETLAAEQNVPEEENASVAQAAEPEPQGGSEPQGAEQPLESGEQRAEEEGTPSEAQRLALEEELEAARAQAQEYLDGWTRERAAFANYKRRVEEERERQRQQLLAEVIKDFLEVLDDLELALKNRPQGEEGAAWAEGIELIYRKLRGRLEAKGVEQVPAEPGQPFDPQYHEAISHEPVDGHESGHIIEVVRPGYRVGDVIVRPALVRVAQ